MARLVVYHPTESARYEALVRPYVAELGLAITTISDPANVPNVIGDVEVLLSTNSFPIETLASATSLRWIHVQGAGVDRWMAAELQPSVRVTRTVGTFGPRMAEYAMANVLAVHQCVRPYDRQQAARRWQTRDATSVSGLRMGIAGFGAIGSALAARAQVFGMHVTGLARTARSAGPFEVVGRDRLHEFLSDLDVVVNVLPQTASTKHLFNAAAFDAMRPTAWFLNMGRGGTVDELALIDALLSESIGGAILDVFETEPLPSTSPLWAMENVVITPHIAGSSIPEEVVTAFIDNARRFLSGDAMLDEVDRHRAY